MKRQGVFRDSESKPDKLQKSCQKAASVFVAAKAPVETVSLFNINFLPDLPFEALFKWIPLVDLLSAQFVCQQWKEASVREVTKHRDSITLRIDGQGEDQKTVRYLERSVWNLPHAEKLKTDDGTPLYPDYVPPSHRSTWNNILLGTRLDNPILLDGSLETSQKHQQWQSNYDQSFEASLDQKVSQLLTLLPGGPRTLTIVCRSQHSDFLRLIPLLNNWKENLVTLNLYSSHPRALDTEQQSSYYGWFNLQNASHSRSSHIDHLSNGPLLDVLNRMSSLRHLTLDLLGEEGDTLNDRQFKNELANMLEESGEMDPDPDFTFFRRLESFTFADRNFGATICSWICTLLSPPLPLQKLHIASSISSMESEYFRNYVRPLTHFFHHLHLHPRCPRNIVPVPLDVVQDPSAFASLSSFFFNLLNTPDMGRSLSYFLQYLTFNVGLVHLRLHLTGKHVTRWYSELDSLREDQRSSLPRLRVLSLILVDDQPIDHRLPSIFQRLFPSLQVIVLHQRLIGTQPQPIQFLEPYLASIKGHFSEAHLPESSSLFLLEARLFLYQEPNFLEVPKYNWGFGAHLNLLQSKEKTWSVEELRTTFIQ